MSTQLVDEHRPASKQRKLNTTPLSGLCESYVILPRRKKHRSPKKKRRRSSSKLTKDEIKYQRFVHDLKKDIDVCMERCIRESRFDTRDDQYLKTNPSFQFLRTTLKPKGASPKTGSHRNNETNTTITSVGKQQDPMSFLKYNESKRLAADVQTILTGPAMKTFYAQFIRPSSKLQQQHPPTLLEESLLNVSDQ